TIEPKRNNGFVRDPNWKPLVNKKDLMIFLNERIKTVANKS
ncbi:MAG: hypothetical protein ACI81T_003393, partial [Bacteroidia bacterium]